jgi:protein O-GlcNAc transferase
VTQRRPSSAYSFTADSRFQQAVALHQQGRVWEAEQLYTSVLQSDDRHFGSLCRLGTIRLQQYRFADAVRLFRRSIKVDRNSADAHHSLGCARMGLGQAQDAIRHYERALAIRPDFAEAHNNLGQALQMLGRVEQTVAHYEKALAIRPGYAEARNNLGNAFHLLDRSEEAIAHYEEALAIKPDYSEAHWNLGNALCALGRLKAAITHYENALTIRPDYAEAHNGLGNALRMLGRGEDAIVHYEKALAIRPGYVDARLHLGNTLEALGRPEEATLQYDKALVVRPSCVEALTNRGTALNGLNRYDEALASFEQALTIEPDNAQALNATARSAAAACDWVRTTKLSGELVARVAEAKLAVDPFAFLGYCSDPALQLVCARTFIRQQVPVIPPPLCKRTAWRHDKIRLAYVAAGFHEHPTAYLTAELFELHDRSRFDVLAISLGPDDGSAMRARLVQAFDEFHDVRFKSDRDIATLINDLQVDIAIDRSGYTKGARPAIFAYRPAPIQVSYIGFPGTLGAEFYDYVIADRIVLPFDQQQFYTEKIVHLPACYLVNDSKRAISAPTPDRQEAGLPAQGFVFCCFNNNSKITSRMFDIWMRLLRTVEGSVLWLLQDSIATESNLRREATARGVEPGRLIFAPWLKVEPHLARHGLADLFLDTLPYNAHTTASDALWAGLPLITCRGESFAGRVAASLLTAVDLTELVTDNLENYETMALRLATEPSLLHGLRERLAQNRSAYPLFDTSRYRRHIEAAYSRMWEMWQRGDSPRSFSVEAHLNA